MPNAADDLHDQIIRHQIELFAVQNQLNADIRDLLSKTEPKLIATIQESVAIADEAKAKRAEAVSQLALMEGELKTALKAAATAQVSAVSG